MFCNFGKIHQIKTRKAHFCYNLSKPFVYFPINVIVKVAFHV